MQNLKTIDYWRGGQGLELGWGSVIVPRLTNMFPVVSSTQLHSKCQYPNQSCHQDVVQFEALTPVRQLPFTTLHAHQKLFAAQV